MIIVYGIAAYLLISFVAAAVVGTLIKKARCNNSGLSWDEDTIEQDNEQLAYFRTRRTM
jgi:hypothetical protein